MENQKKNSSMVIIIILAVLLLLSVGYIIYREVIVESGNMQDNDITENDEGNINKDDQIDNENQNESNNKIDNNVDVNYEIKNLGK